MPLWLVHDGDRTLGMRLAMHSNWSKKTVIILPCKFSSGFFFLIQICPTNHSPKCCNLVRWEARCCRKFIHKFCIHWVDICLLMWTDASLCWNRILWIWLVQLFSEEWNSHCPAKTFLVKFVNCLWDQLKMSVLTLTKVWFSLCCLLFLVPVTRRRRIIVNPQ